MSKVVVKFHAGDFLLDNALQLGRPFKVDSDSNRDIENNHLCSTTWEITDILKISKSIKLLVKMKYVFYFTEKTKQTFWSTQYLPIPELHTPPNTM